MEHRYGERGGLTQTVFPDAVIRTPLYDMTGNLIRDTYSDGLVLEYGRDARGG